MHGLAWAAAGFALASLLGLGPGVGAQAKAGPRAAVGHASLVQGPAKVDRAAFDEAVDLVLHDYVDDVDANAVLGRALDHMVSGLDAHSVYLDAQGRRRWQRQRREGLTTGLHLRRVAGRGDFEVADVVPGTPADKAGIAVGDRILSVGDRPALDFRHPLQAEIAATALDGETVALRVAKSGGAERRLELASARVDPVSVIESKLLVPGEDAPAQARAQKIAWIHLHAFVPGVAAKFKARLAELRRAAGGRLDGLVIDLRHNPGGEVQEALRIAELFVDEGVLVRTRGRDRTILDEERAHRAGSDPKLALVVLQDEHSASASELLAAALQGHGRARVVGRTSHGKGTVQRLYGLPDGAQLRLTVARYYGPSDQPIDGRGVLPDLPLSPQEMLAPIAHAWAYLAKAPDSAPESPRK